MTRYALLLQAGSNRVYGESAFALAAAELDLLGERVLHGRLGTAERTTVARVDYLVAEAAEPLGAGDLAVVSNLSSLHALFAVDADDRFRPVPVTPLGALDGDLLTIQRYAGKTNEAFTHLLVNVALAASADGLPRLLAGERLRLLDPVCGRGTTLNRAAVYGMDAYGVELDHGDVEAHDVFFSTWLKDKRLKHKVQRATLRKGRSVPAHRVTTTYGAGRDLDAHRVVDLVHDDTTAAADHFAARSMDVLACDLPYGVQHGSRSSAGARHRGPERLLEQALPGWLRLLRPGAGAAFAWNRRTLSRERLSELVDTAGFAIVDGGDDRFVHRVDRAITRDVLVAARPG